MSVFKESRVLKMMCSSAIVGQICCLLTCLITAVKALAIVSPSQSLSTSFTNFPLVNTTTLDSGIDSRFGFKIEYGETDLPKTPCLMNAVELLAQYAECDWLGTVRTRRGVVLPEYPQVEFAVIPAPPATSVEVRAIVWGIWVAIRDMISNNSFHEVEMEILWELQAVAYFYITLPMDLKIAGQNGSLGNDEPLTLLPGSNITTGGNLDISNTSEYSPDALNAGTFSWEPIFGPTAKTLTVFEVFLTVMAGLKNAASHVASDKVPGSYASAAMDVNANVQFYIHKRRSPRPRPPYFQYIHVIRALRLVPGYMLEKKRFAEMFFMIEVDGMAVGEGYLERGHRLPPHFDVDDMLGPKDNVSVS